jgi:hypothetical protein
MHHIFACCIFCLTCGLYIKREHHDAHQERHKDPNGQK